MDGVLFEAQKTMFFGNISKNKKYFFLIVFAPPRRVFKTTFVKISKVSKIFNFFKIFRTFFPRFFRFFEVCTSGDLVDFLEVSSAGDLEGISERILLRILIRISKRI